MQNRKTLRHREQTCGCQGGGGWEKIFANDATDEGLIPKVYK